MQITRNGVTVTVTMIDEEAVKLASELSARPQGALAEQLMQGLSKVDALTAERYATRVVLALRRHHPNVSFGGHRETQVLVDALAAYVENPYPEFEMIVDHPSVAHWKLVPWTGQAPRLAVVCCRPCLTEAEVEVERHMNSKLADIRL